MSIKNIKSYLFKSSVIIGTLSPLVAFAQTTFRDIVIRLVNVIELVFPVIGGLIVLMFLWAMAKYVIINADSAEKGRAKGMIVWSLVAIFITFSVWGLVNILQSTILGGGGAGARGF